MRRILVFGNSGSGKSTLATKMCDAEGLVHLDLDLLAWEDSTPPQRKPLDQSGREILKFIDAQPSWVIEGCYTDLLQLALPFANEMIYLSLSVAECIENAKARPWEPHKYATKQAQDKNLSMLIEWISDYPSRQDTFSATAHQSLYDQFSGKKKMIRHNE